MPTCRNKLMNEGKPYPRSGCAICGSMFSGKLLCTQNVHPNPPAGSDLKPEHYADVAPSVPAEKYAIIYKDTIHHAGDQRSRDCPGHGYPAYTETIEKIRVFESKQALVDWIDKNDTGYGRVKFTAIQYRELKVSTKVEIDVS